jgi:preprotein translocase subunit SecE
MTDITDIIQTIFYEIVETIWTAKRKPYDTIFLVVLLILVVASILIWYF